MKKLKNGNQNLQEEMQNRFDDIDKAEVCRVLLWKLLDEMQLPRNNVDMQVFADTYSKIQNRALDHQVELKRLHEEALKKQNGILKTEEVGF